MSPIKGWLTPEARAGLDAVLSKWAAPAMCDPADESPIVDGCPSEQAIENDLRSPAQRNHDALVAMCRSTLASGQLGSHGLPVSIIVSTTLQELEAAAGLADTGGGSWLPMAVVIRMASHARHYPRFFIESEATHALDAPKCLCCKEKCWLRDNNRPDSRGTR